MSTYRVIFTPKARQELVDLYEYIATQSGFERAGAFVGDIRDYCMGFSAFPERGTRRDDIVPGLRLVGYRRRVSIVFALEGDAVLILGIYYGGRQFGPVPIDEGDESDV